MKLEEEEEEEEEDVERVEIARSEKNKQVQIIHDQTHGYSKKPQSRTFLQSGATARDSTHIK